MDNQTAQFLPVLSKRVTIALTHVPPQRFAGRVVIYVDVTDHHEVRQAMAAGPPTGGTAWFSWIDTNGYPYFALRIGYESVAYALRFSTRDDRDALWAIARWGVLSVSPVQQNVGIAGNTVTVEGVGGALVESSLPLGGLDSVFHEESALLPLAGLIDHMNTLVFENEHEQGKYRDLR